MPHLRRCAISLLILATLASAYAQERTIGLIHREAGAFEGYTLFNPLRSTTTYLIDIDGDLVHSWESQFRPGHAQYLLENGHLLRAGTLAGTELPRFDHSSVGGMIEEFDWEGTLLWQYRFADSMHAQHHDIEPMPNGNVLLLAWEYKSAEQALAAGRDPELMSEGELWPNMIAEVHPIYPDSAEIVWEWHIWDHLIQDFDSTKANFGVVADHPELMDLNFTMLPQTGDPAVADWNHENAIDYNAGLDQIAVSYRHQDEILVIDHSTTAEEAAGHSGGNAGRGGDILYRWGNPAAYRAATIEDRVFRGQHDVRWIEEGLPGAGHLMVFNNGFDGPGGPMHSTVDEIEPPLLEDGTYAHTVGQPYGPSDVHWRFTADPPSSLYSRFISGARRLPNGNTLICAGIQGDFREVTNEGEEVWRYINPVTADGPQHQGVTIVFNEVFRATRYAPGYAAFEGRDLAPQGPIELYSNVAGAIPATIRDFSVSTFPNPFNAEMTIALEVNRPQRLSLNLVDLLGREAMRIDERDFSEGAHLIPLHAAGLPSGLYYLRVTGNQTVSLARPVMLLR